MRILIVNYFLNEKYNSLKKIIQWIENISKYYLIDCERKILIYTDNSEASSLLSKYPNVEIKSNFYNVPTNSNLTNRYFKSFYVLDSVKNNKDCDYISFIQSNARCTQKIFANDIIDKTKYLSINNHYWFNNNFMKLYHNYDSFICNLKNKNITNWKYYHCNHYIGKPEIIYDILSTVVSWQFYDLINGYISKITTDEGYFNYYLNNNINSVNINGLDRVLFDGTKPGRSKLYFINKKERIWKSL